MYYLSIGEERGLKSINHNEKIQIKLEIDTDPPPHARVDNHWVHTPVSFTVLTLHPSDLFAGKMHALLYRAWKGRIKGRDWYDFNWYIRRGIPLGIKYLESCMHQAGNLPRTEMLSRDYVLQLLNERIQAIDWMSAKEDVRNFVTDPRTLDVWSSEFFASLLPHLKIE